MAFIPDHTRIRMNADAGDSVRGMFGTVEGLYAEAYDPDVALYTIILDNGMRKVFYRFRFDIVQKCSLFDVER